MSLALRGFKLSNISNLPNLHLLLHLKNVSRFGHVGQPPSFPYSPVGESVSVAVSLHFPRLLGLRPGRPHAGLSLASGIGFVGSRVAPSLPHSNMQQHAAAANSRSAAGAEVGAEVGAVL